MAMMAIQTTDVRQAMSRMNPDVLQLQTQKRLKSCSELQTSASFRSGSSNSSNSIDSKKVAAPRLSSFNKLKMKLLKARTAEKVNCRVEHQFPRDDNDDDAANIAAAATVTTSSGISAATKDSDYSAASQNFVMTSLGNQKTAGYRRSLSTPTQPALCSGMFTFHPGDGYEDFPCKYQCPKLPTILGSPQTPERPSIDQVLQTLSSSGSLDSSTCVAAGAGATAAVDDKSPLINADPPCFGDATSATSFDNIAAVTRESSDSNLSQAAAAAGYGHVSGLTAVCTTSASQYSNTSNNNKNSSNTTNGGTILAESRAGGAATGSNTSPPRQATGGAAKKRKGLSIMIPSLAKDKESNATAGGMRQLSAAEERKIDEAIELANSFARADFGGLLTPRSLSGSSKESLDSPGYNSSSHGSVFRFPFRRRPAGAAGAFVSSATSGVQQPAAVGCRVAAGEGKKTAGSFDDGLSLTCDTSAIFTADAQAAYNQLVAMCPLSDAATEAMTTKLPSGRQFRMHRLVSESPAPRPSLARRLQRSSLSESDQGLVVSLPVGLTATAAVSAKSTTGRRSEEFRRSTSLTDEATSGSGVAGKHRILLDSVSSSDAEKKIEETSEPAASTSSTPPANRAPSPPPALPPRIPLRPSTVNARPWQRGFPLMTTPRGSVIVSTSAAQHRSVSEALQKRNRSRHHTATTVTTGSQHQLLPDVVLPRRATKSTGDGGSVVLTEVDPATSATPSLAADSLADSVSGHLNSTQDSDDSVFSSGSDDQPTQPAPPPRPVRYSASADQPPRSAAPLPPQRLTVIQQMQLRQRRSSNGPRMTARELGYGDAADLFWCRPVDFDRMALSQSELDLLDELDPSQPPMAGRYKTSDAVSYEDLMEFALDRPNRRRNQLQSDDSGDCDEVRLMRKLLSKNVTADECVDALSQTQWDVHSAIKLIKLDQLLSTGLADEQNCKQALMECRWDVQQAATRLLGPSTAAE
jgi:hypothetical protein